jgi:hypothetical protein
MGNGDGTFQARVEYPGTTQISLLVAEDFDRDGKVDIVSVNYMAAGTVSFYRGIGDGTFAAKVDGQTTDAYVQRMKTADLNGDGYLDLVITSNYQGLNVMLGNGDGTFNAKTNYKTTTQGSALAIADVNSDGILDIIATGFLATPFMGPIRINLGK